MGESFEFDVFLSHSSKDKNIVRPLAERLRQDGLKVWLDEWEIKPGDSIPSKIEEGLENSRILVLCMSKNAFGSDWPQLESQTFRFRDPLNKERRFIPLRLDDFPIKGSLAQFLYIDWCPALQGKEYAKLLEACRVPTKPQPLKNQERFLKHVISLGHTHWIRSVAWSPDGKLALSGANDSTVRLWDIQSGQAIRVLEGHKGSVFSVAWSPNGKLAISGAQDRTVRLWDISSGNTIRVLEGHKGDVRNVAWSPDGKLALSGANDSTMRLWDIQSGKAIQVLEGHQGSVLSVAWSPDGKLAISGAQDRTMRLWDIQSGQAIRVLEGHQGSVRSIAWSLDGKLAISGANDTTIRLWDIQSGQAIRILEGHKGPVRSVAWCPDGMQVISGADDHTVRLWDISSGNTIRVLEGHQGPIWSVAWSPDGRMALSGAQDKTVRLWDIQSGKVIRMLEGHQGHVRSMAWSPDEKLVISGAQDSSMRLWDIQSGKAIRVLEGHKRSVRCVAWSPDGKQAISGAEDCAVRLWDIQSGKTIRVLEGHKRSVRCVAWSPNEKLALSGAQDNTIRLWDIQSGKSIQVLEGHQGSVWSVVWSPNGKLALSGAQDKTVRLWDIQSGKTIRVLEGHKRSVRCVAWSPNEKLALSGAQDNTIRLWDIQSGKSIQVLEGHQGPVWSVAWRPDGRMALSGAEDNTLRLWDIQSGKAIVVLEGHQGPVWSVAWSPDGKMALSGALNGVMRLWDLAELSTKASKASLSVHSTTNSSTRGTLFVEEQIQYTNAKVLLVGDTSSGKTGLTHRLATGQWKPSDGSTVGAWSTQWALSDVAHEKGLEQEIWLWDFGGQADQRLVHQLYMDRTALILLLFDADKENVLPGLREWQTALHHCITDEIPHLLVAGRTDAGFKASRLKLQTFAQENKFTYFETSAKEGTGCDELRSAIKQWIPWDQLEKHTSPKIFKLIKDQILKLRDKGEVLHTFKELREELALRLPGEERFSDETLRTVIGLLNGPGVVKELDYGTYVLLQPEWINAYAQAVIRTLRSDEKELGCLPLRSIAEGKLLFQTVGHDGEINEMKRLPGANERVVLREMERQLEERGLCLRQGDKLVFPSHCGRDRPAVKDYPSVFVSYEVKGYLDDIYATLVVRLADSESFLLDQLWRDAADFKTLNGHHHMGIKLDRDAADTGMIDVYFAPGVTIQEQVIFANYINNHLKDHCEQAKRLRHYVCPHCHTPKGNPQVLMKKLLSKKTEATVECDICEERFDLWDDLERLFADNNLLKQVEGLSIIDSKRLDSRRKGKLLALEVGARITSADQKCFEIPATEDEGLDMEVEFTDDNDKGTGKRLYLQLKSGNSHLDKLANGNEVFRIKNQRWVEYWMKQPHPVMLVIGTFAKDEKRTMSTDKLEFDEVRWMEISSYLEDASQNGSKPVPQIDFKGERLDMTSIYSWRNKLMD